MNIEGKVWKSKKDRFWLADIPFLNLMVQATTKKEIPGMVKDAIELLIHNKHFKVDALVVDKTLYIESNNPKKLIALILKRRHLETV